MWQLANKKALPSTEELMRRAKGATKELEIILEDAVELPEQTKARVYPVDMSESWCLTGHL
jgi:hypothetical protein